MINEHESNESSFGTKGLISNTVIFTIGNFGTRILSLIILPIYTYYITTVEMGQYDLFLTMVSLLVPIATLQISDGVLRWLLDKESNVKQTISVCCRVYIVCSLAFSAVFIVYTSLFHISYRWYLLATILLNGLFTILQCVARGMQQNKLYAFSGILYSFVFLTLSVIFVVVYHMQCVGMIYSMLIAYIVGNIVLIVSQKQLILSGISTKPELGYIKRMLIYCLPLIVNVFGWWLISGITKFVIERNIGIEANGIYAMAAKLPTALQSITSIFYLAWFQSDVANADDSRQDSFSNSVLNRYWKLLMLICAVLIPFTKFVSLKLFEPAYQDAWIPSILLYIGVVFYALSSFLGVKYVISKTTMRIMTTTLICGLIAFGLSYIMAKPLGLIGVSAATAVAYTILFLIRYRDCWRNGKAQLSPRNSLFSFGAVCLSAILTFIIPSPIIVLALCIVFGIVFVTSFRHEIRSMLTSIILRLKRKR